MREVLVAVYNTAAQTNQAVRALEAANVPSASIRRYHRDDPAIRQVGESIEQRTTTVGETTTTGTATGETHRGFWSWLLGEEGSQTTYAQDENLYGRSIDSGNTVLAVDVDQSESERVMSILAEHNPIGLEDATGTLPAAGATTVGSTDTVTGVQATTPRTSVTPETTPTTGTVPETAALRDTGRTTETEETIPLAEEHVEIGKRQIEQPVRVRRYVVERPVERQVNLQDERVEIERRRPTTDATAAVPGGAFEERVVEVHTKTEEPVVSKTTGVAEEVVVRKETDQRTETVRDTERKEEVEVERGTERDPGRARP